MLTDFTLLQNESGADAISPAKPKSVNAKPSVASKERPSKKRPSPSEDSGTVAKKRRKSQPELGPERALSSPPSQAVEEEKPKHAPKPKTNKLTKESSARSKKVIPKRTRDPSPKESESELSDTFDEPPEPANNGEASDSDLSILIDADPPPKKKNRKGSIAAAGKPTKNKSSSTSRPKSETATTDPDLAEIKRLQGWLVKCGVRKLWGKELKPYESPKAKIKHLKDMLADAGMSGRYSIEKASQIKEERELKADIEAVKEGAERWGKKAEDVDGDVDDDGDGDGDARAKPKRRLIRGAQVLDFLDSDEGEETD